MSGTAAAPVIAGLAVGIGFILIVSLFPVGVSRTTTTLSPVLSLVTMDDGKSYNTHSGIYCGQSCDVLIFARVLPLPQIPVSNGSEIAFRATNYRGQQLGELHLIIQEIKQEDAAGGSSGGPNLIEANTQLAKTRSGNFKVENLPAGMYVINVIADWKGEQNPDFSHSLHRFTVNVTAGGNNGNDPSSSSSEIKTGHSNGTVSVVVIPRDAGSQSGKNFEPSTIKVVIGVNNTVRWTNNDDVLSSVVADNANEDPDFATATQFPSGSIPANATNYLQQGQSFEFTFNRPGEIHYHSEPHPWLQGTVLVLQASQTFTLNNNTYDEAAIPLVANRQYMLDDVIFTYLGNTTADAGQCPPADLKPFNELYHGGNEIKHFNAILKNGTKVNMDTCWPLPHTPVIVSPSQTGQGVSTGLQKRGEWRWFDSDSRTAGIMQDQTYFVPDNTTFYYFAERKGMNPNENALPSGPSPRVTASIEGLSENSNNTYALNSVIRFQAKVEGRYAEDDCGTLRLFVECKRTNDDYRGSYMQVSSWNEMLPYSTKASADDGSKANFEYFFPQDGNSSYTFTPTSTGEYRITATVATANNGIYSTYRTFTVG